MSLITETEDAMSEPEYVAVPWEPTTLEDLNWLLQQHHAAVAELALLEAQHERRIAPLKERLASTVTRYGPCIKRLLRENLPRRKDGSFRSKSLDCPHGRVSLKTTPGGPRVVDEAQVRDWLERLADKVADEPDELQPVVLNALRAERREMLIGFDAWITLQDERDTGWTALPLLKMPVLDYVKATGDLVPGVELVPDMETVRIEAVKE